jgi:tryptophan synthase alpha chain
MNLNAKLLTGFGISDRSSFEKACSYTNGAIIGSAFVKALSGKGTIEEKVKVFVENVR